MHSLAGCDKLATAGGDVIGMWGYTPVRTTGVLVKSLDRATVVRF